MSSRIAQAGHIEVRVAGTVFPRKGAPENGGRKNEADCTRCSPPRSIIGRRLRGPPLAIG